MLAVGMLAVIAGSTFQYGLAYLIPAFLDRGLSLKQAGILVACPTAGVTLALIAWGAAIDRWGERVVLSTGLGLAGLILLTAAWTQHTTVLTPGSPQHTTALTAGSTQHTTTLAVCLVLAGAATASVLGSGRLILGWFARHERGLAMGIRQSAGPTGLALAAATLPALAVHGTKVPLLFLATLFLLAATTALLLVRDPSPSPAPSPAAPAAQPVHTPAPVRDPAAQPAPDSAAQPEHTPASVRDPAAQPAPTPAPVRDPAVPPPAARAATVAASPYRTPSLWRIHAASALLVVPQFTVTTFALVFLTDARGWSALAAGHLLAGAQLCGALSRLAAGHWSDRTGSRLRPMRIIAITTGAGLLALAATAGTTLAVPLLLFLGVVAASSNGLSFTAVAEQAGSAWAGRALGIQTTGQNLLTTATPPIMALTIGAAGFAPSFAVVAALPLLAALLVPVASEHIPAPPAPDPAARRTD